MLSIENVIIGKPLPGFRVITNIEYSDALFDRIKKICSVYNYFNKKYSLYTGIRSIDKKTYISFSKTYNA